MMVYRYWVEPASAQDAMLLMRQLARAAAYRRELIDIENRARVMTRAILSLPKDQRAPYYKLIAGRQRWATKFARDRAREDRPLPLVSEDGPGWKWHGEHGRFGGRTRGADWDLGCAWGTCGVVDDAQDQSQRTTSIVKDLPTFVAHDEGVLAVQYQQHASLLSWKPTSAASLVGGQSTLCRIGGELCGKQLRSGREGAKRLRTVMFRIGSDGARPVWAHLYTLIHQPLPDARVAWVKLVCRRVALRYRWHLIVVVDQECRGRPDAARSAAVGIDIGWRKMPDGGIRVAYWHGTDGREGELVIPEHVHRRKGKSDSLQAIRDRERNEVGALWREWIDGIPSNHPLRVAMHSKQRLRVGRYVTLARIWERHRMPGDEAMFQRVTGWLAHDRHLYAWQAHNVRRMRLEVESRIRDLAVQLARRYELVAVEDRGMVPELVKRDPSADEDERRQRHLNATRVVVVAPAFVRSQLERFAKKYGAVYREIDPANTTRRCASCGAIRTYRDPAVLMLQCDACGVLEDQDRTSARNIERTASAQMRDEVERALEVGSSGACARKMRPRRTRRSRPQIPLANSTASTENDG